ncbi:unnamed protein product, partial [Discosporangium mesarthrocarpum]
MPFAIFVVNRTSTIANKGKSPHLKLFGEVGSLAAVPTFGTPGYYRVGVDHRLAQRGKPCIMLGMEVNEPRGTFQMLDIKTNKVLKRTGVHLHLIKDGKIAFPTLDHPDVEEHGGEGEEEGEDHYIILPHLLRR